MTVVIRKRALNAIIKAALYVESLNTAGSGDRWLMKLKNKINSLARSKVKYAICTHPSLAKFNYRCYTYNAWIIAFRITEKEFEVCRFIYGKRLS